MSGDLSFDGTLLSFFYEQLEQARVEHDEELGVDVEAYVVHMLANHARRTNIAGRTSPALATAFLSAREQGPAALREVGDRALYIAGVVPRSIDRTPVDINYVSGIGEAAYREIHTRSKSLDVFARLADQFRAIVDLLGRMLSLDADNNLLALYERWRRGCDPRDARLLVRAGVLLDPATADIIQ